MWTSSIAAAARTAASPPSAPAQSRTSSGRSRLPPAASVAVASSPSELAVAGASLAQRLLHLAQPGRQPAARGVEDRGDRRRDGRGAGHPRTPLWIAMIPPASTVQRIRSSPAASIFSARPRGPGKLRTDSGR